MLNGEASGKLIQCAGMIMVIGSPMWNWGAGRDSRHPKPGVNPMRGHDNGHKKPGVNPMRGHNNGHINAIMQAGRRPSTVYTVKYLHQ
jgi:hypothetical protein